MFKQVWENRLWKIRNRDGKSLIPNAVQLYETGEQY